MRVRIERSLRGALMVRRTLLVIDTANAVGAVADGWWRDRRGATERLRDAIAAIPMSALEELTSASHPFEIVLVVEGRARGIASLPTVRVVDAKGTADDEIVALIQREGDGRDCLVVTSDRALLARVGALGARRIGPKRLRALTA